MNSLTSLLTITPTPRKPKQTTSRKSKRDYQRQKVYNAEAYVYLEKPDLPEIEDLRQFIDKVTRTKFWKNLGGSSRITLGDGRSRKSAFAQPLTKHIKMPRDHRYTQIVLHELAHLVVPLRYPWHGTHFAKTYLALVVRFMGREAGRTLRSRFKEYRVRYRITEKYK